MNVTPFLADDPGVHLLGIQLSAKRASKAVEVRVHRELRRVCRRTVIPFIPKATS